MTSAVLTFCLAAIGFATARTLGSGGASMLLFAVIVVGPYLLCVPPRTEQDWLAVKVCLIWLIVWLAAPGVRLISR